MEGLDELDGLVEEEVEGLGEPLAEWDAVPDID